MCKDDAKLHRLLYFASVSWSLNRLQQVCYKKVSWTIPAAFLIGQNMGKYLLRDFKILRLFFVQFLIMGLIANSLLPQACYCGEACRHGLQDTTKARQRFPFHTRCPGNQCPSCNAEDLQTIKLSNASHLTAKLKTINAPLISFNIPDHQPNVDFIRIFFSRRNPINAPTMPQCC